jgi:hypothetical protein
MLDVMKFVTWFMLLFNLHKVTTLYRILFTVKQKGINIEHSILAIIYYDFYALALLLYLDIAFFIKKCLPLRVAFFNTCYVQGVNFRKDAFFVWKQKQFENKMGK